MAGCTHMLLVAATAQALSPYSQLGIRVDPQRVEAVSYTHLTLPTKA